MRISSSFNKTAGIDFSVSAITYDYNGNLKTMQQKGLKGTSSLLIDNLSYTYIGASIGITSNRLAKVVDAAANPNSTLGDFVDGANSGDDYAYDGNGNLTLDKNKGITSILYTHQNLPYEIKIAGKGKINYIYDNLGRRWKKIVVDSTQSTVKTTTWLYMLNTVYKNDTLQFFTHEEGRARYDTTEGTGEAKAFYFDYFLKDHLGNTRMVLTKETNTQLYDQLNLEGNPGSPEVLRQNAQWEDKTGASINVTATRVARPGSFGNAGSNGSYVILARKSTGAIGAAKLLKVMAGDRLHTKVESFYTVANANNSGASGINSLVANLASAIGASSQVGAALKDGTSSIASGLSGVTALVNLLNTANNTSGGNNAPKAYLNVLFFDEQFKYDASASLVRPIPYGPNAPQPNNLIGSNAVEAKKNGYAYIYVSNE
ncbi:MAG: hypothetical protein JNL51_02895, partial [Chitinophagaceae bacterium]|nr:hypothetical protein [Chitinophagaceae bacterium]